MCYKVREASEQGAAAGAVSCRCSLLGWRRKDRVQFGIVSGVDKASNRTSFPAWIAASPSPGPMAPGPCHFPLNRRQPPSSSMPSIYPRPPGTDLKLPSPSPKAASLGRQSNAPAVGRWGTIGAGQTTQTHPGNGRHPVAQDLRWERRQQMAGSAVAHQGSAGLPTIWRAFCNPAGQRPSPSCSFPCCLGCNLGITAPETSTRQNPALSTT